MGKTIRDGPDKPATAKANTHTYRTKNRKTEQEGPSSHPVTVTLETVPKPDRKTGKERKKQSERQQKRPKAGHRKPHPRQIRSPKPEYLCKKYIRNLHIYRISYTQSQPNGKSIGSERFYDWRTMKASPTPTIP